MQTKFWSRQGISLLAAIILILGLLSIWFNDPTRLATAFGPISAGLAFALQQVVTSIAGYFVILRGSTFTVGDRISMGGVRGDVMRLGFIQTTIMEMGQPPSVVQDRDTFAGRKERSEAYRRPRRFHTIELPRNSAVGVVIGLSCTAAAFALVWYIWWLALAGLLAAWNAVIARSFVRKLHRTIPASEVARIEDRWLAAVAATQGVPRELETSSVNRGLAEPVM